MSSDILYTVYRRVSRDDKQGTRNEFDGFIWILSPLAFMTGVGTRHLSGHLGRELSWKEARPKASPGAAERGNEP